MKAINFEHVDIKEGFWGDRQSLNKNITLEAVYNQFKKAGRFDALHCNWKEGSPNKPWIWWDSDVAKWIEGASNILIKEPNEELEKLIDKIIDQIAESQMEDGYFNSYYIRFGGRWKNRLGHELYCIGHLIEAAVAYYQATKKDKFVQLVCKMADHVYQVFVEENSAEFITPGHPEIELALVKLYELNKNRKYLELSKFFIDKRGAVEESDNESQNQSHLPVRQQTTAEGHAVKAVYLYSAMADLGRLYNDKELIDACNTIFQNIITKKMYVTGGIGSEYQNEKFMNDFYLPNLLAYSETCSSIGFVLFLQRMLKIEAKGIFADIIELLLYNAVLSGISLDGKAFFYVNPLEIQPDYKLPVKFYPETGKVKYMVTQRQENFPCPCCPPNLIRLLASLGSYIYSEDKKSLYIHQYIANTMKCDGMEVDITTEYPQNGQIRIKVKGPEKVFLRIPAWCKEYQLRRNGEAILTPAEQGYVMLSLDGNAAEIELNLKIETELLHASPNIRACSGKHAVKRGPIVYCMEGIDNKFALNGLQFDKNVTFEEEYDPYFHAVVLSAEVNIPDPTEYENTLYSSQEITYQKKRLKFIPYFGFANRGETEMRVWI